MRARLTPKHRGVAAAGAPTTRSTPTLAAGVGAVTILALASGYLLGEEAAQAADAIAFVVNVAIALGLVAFIFLRVVPRAAAEARAARAGLKCAVLGVLTLPVWWSGLPIVLGAGAITLGLVERDRAASPSRTAATVALVLGAVTVLLALGVVVGDELS